MRSHQSSLARRSVVQKFVNGSIEDIRMQNICNNEYANVSLSGDHQLDLVTDWNEFRQFLSNISQPCSEMLVMCRYALELYDCMKLFDAVLSDEGMNLCNVFHPSFDFEFVRFFSRTLLHFQFAASKVLVQKPIAVS